MACPSITVSAAVDALRAAGRTVTRATGTDAARRYGCQTLRYVVDGRAVNIGRLRQLALAAADAAPVPMPAPRPVLPGEVLPPQPPVTASPGPILPVLPTRFAGGGFAGLTPWGNMPGYPQPGHSVGN